MRRPDTAQTIGEGMGSDAGDCKETQGAAIVIADSGRVAVGMLNFDFLFLPIGVSAMAHVSLIFEDVENADQINRLTTALMMVDGVDSVEVHRYGAEVRGDARREALIAAAKALGIRAH